MGPRSSVPSARATGLYAKTVFRQLQQAGYGAVEVVAFVNKLLEELAANGDKGDALSAIGDLETALPNEATLLEAIAFDLDRAAERRTEVALVAVEVVLPDTCADDVAAGTHLRLARTLGRGVRASDLVARVGPSSYVLLLPGVDAQNIDAVADRLVAPLLEPRRSEDRPPSGTRLLLRAANGRAGEDARALLGRCLDAAPRAPAPPRARRSVAPPAHAERTGDRVVLALGGGAARAAAHIGVLRALAARRIQIDGVAATSAGALVGAMAVLGMDHDAILARFVDFTKSATYREMRKHYVRYRRRANVPRATVAYFRDSGLAFLSNEDISAFDDGVFGSFVEFFVGPDRDISTMPKPFCVVATDLVSGRAIDIAHGPLHLALRASCALPGLFAPQREGGRLLVDGAMIAEVPVRAATSLAGGATVLAVHLARPERRIAAFGTSSEVVLRSSSIVHTELVREQLRHAGRLVTVRVEDIGWLDFRRARETADLGEAAAREHLATS